MDFAERKSALNLFHYLNRKKTRVRLAILRFSARYLFIPPLSSFTHFQNESSYTSQPKLVGFFPAVSNIPSSHIFVSVRLDNGGTMILCFFIRSSISESRSFTRPS